MSAIDVNQVRSLLEQAQHGAKGKATPSPASEFSELLRDTSSKQKGAEQAFENYALEGKGELHDVMTQMAKADVAFKFLLEVRNKLTDAWAELSRLQV